MYCFSFNSLQTNPAFVNFGQMLHRMSNMQFNLGLAALTSGPGLPFMQPQMNMPISFGPFNRSVPSFNNGAFNKNTSLFNGVSYYSGNNNSFGGFNQYQMNNFNFGGFNQYTPANLSLAGFNIPMPRKSYLPDELINMKPLKSENESNSNETSKTNTKTNQKVSSENDVGAVNTDGVTLNRKGNGYGPEFLNKVKQIATRLNCNYRDLLGLMNSESGISAHAKNPGGSASGLIQIIDSSAREIGTTSAEIRNMDPITQLDYVEKYLARAKQIAGFSPDSQLSAGDLYAIVFLPGRAKRETLTASGETYFAQNHTALDLDSDGKITKSDLAQKVRNSYVNDNSFLA